MKKVLFVCLVLAGGFLAYEVMFAESGEDGRPPSDAGAAETSDGTLGSLSRSLRAGREKKRKSAALTVEDARRAGVRFSEDGRVLVRYPKELRANAFRIPDGVRIIGKDAFRGCLNLETVELPDGVIEIQEGAFFDCRNLRRIRFGAGLESIGAEAFARCARLKSPELPDTLRTIGAEAFSCCESFESVRIPRGVTRIPAKAFFLCSALETVELHEECRRIGAHAFLNCGRLRRLLPWVEDPNRYEIKTIPRRDGKTDRWKVRATHAVMEELGAGAFSGTPLDGIVLKRK